MCKEIGRYYGCYGWGFGIHRRFLTRQERIALLKEYQDELEKEKQGVAERIKELEAC
jgi:hypothetical protein